MILSELYLLSKGSNVEEVIWRLKLSPSINILKTLLPLDSEHIRSLMCAIC